MAKFQFDAEVQNDILRLLLKDTNFLDAAQQWIDPNYFEGRWRQLLSETILDFYKSYKLVPTRGQIKTQFRIQWDGREDPEEVNKGFEQIDSLMDIPITSTSYTTDVVAQFAQVQAWKKAILKALPIVDDPNQHDQLMQIMQEANRVVANAEVGGTWYFETATERIRRRSDEEFIEQDVFPTGIFELDSVLRMGGICRGEIGLWLAPTNGGKSIALGQMARRAVWDNRNVAFFSFEMSDAKIADRMDAGFSAIPMSRLLEQESDLSHTMSRLATRFKDRLWIKRFPTKGATIEDCARSLHGLLRQYRWKPDMIVLDYAGIVKPSMQRERHLEMQEVLEEFRGLCIDQDAAGWTAGQTNKISASARVVRGEHVAGSWDSLGICDYILTICLEDHERIANVLRIFLEKSRDGIAKVEIGPLASDWSRMCFVRRTNSAIFEPVRTVARPSKKSIGKPQPSSEK